MTFFYEVDELSDFNNNFHPKYRKKRQYYVMRNQKNPQSNKIKSFPLTVNNPDLGNLGVINFQLGSLA